MVLSAIMHAHQKGIIHRDLKFENILWESDAPDAQIKVRALWCVFVYRGGGGGNRLFGGFWGGGGVERGCSWDGEC